MSYGIGIIIPKDDLNKSQIRWNFCAWTLPIAVKADSVKNNLKDLKRWYKEFENETNLTSLDKLLNAPCDCVCIIDKKGNFSTLKPHKPINIKNVENIITYLIQYLQI